MLLKDGRIDPNAQDCTAVESAGNIETALVLLSDPRVILLKDDIIEEYDLEALLEMIQNVREDKHQELPRYIPPEYIDVLVGNCKPFTDTSKYIQSIQICLIKFRRPVLLDGNRYTNYMNANDEDRKKICQCFFDPIERALKYILQLKPCPTEELVDLIEYLTMSHYADFEDQEKLLQELFAETANKLIDLKKL